MTANWVTRSKEMQQQRCRTWLAISGMAAGLYGVGSLFQPTVVVGDSMSPTLKGGRWIWVDRTCYARRAPRSGEVVVFRLNGTTYVKRVYRGPGEEIAYVAHGLDWLGPIREHREAEMKRRYEATSSFLKVKKMRVPDDSVFVLGDNYERSEDSRQLGPIPISCIIGRARVPVDTTRTLNLEFVPHSHRSTYGVRHEHAGKDQVTREARRPDSA